ncbi:hypothetical protein F2P81_022741 [Scophthalmus maximus]|uniref:Uncharacterized protein n=1 Tax=Scophthalmus maximus TaxID=52904 RepID=A0A6A4S2H1_SCOMX|nr:hypothetical protein F2P81_022741 [Scophthalmus maximus]
MSGRETDQTQRSETLAACELSGCKVGQVNTLCLCDDHQPPAREEERVSFLLLDVVLRRDSNCDASDTESMINKSCWQEKRSRFLQI